MTCFAALLESVKNDNFINLSAEFSGFKYVGDNIDKNVKPRFMRVDRRTESLHYFNAYAVKDRVDSSSLSPKMPSPRLELDVATILPSEDDLHQLVQNCTTLLSRVLIEYFPMFSALEDVVCKHIQHAESKAMKQKSIVVS